MISRQGTGRPSPSAGMRPRAMYSIDQILGNNPQQHPDDNFKKHEGIYHILVSFRRKQLFGLKCDIITPIY